LAGVGRTARETRFSACGHGAATRAKHPIATSQAATAARPCGPGIRWLNADIGDLAAARAVVVAAAMARSTAALRAQAECAEHREHQNANAFGCHVRAPLPSTAGNPEDAIMHSRGGNANHPVRGETVPFDRNRAHRAPDRLSDRARKSWIISITYEIGQKALEKGPRVP